jgi:ATP synthase protein I
LNESPNGEVSEVGQHQEISDQQDKVTNFDSSDHASNGYVQLQRDIYILTLALSVLIVFCTAFFAGFNTSISILIGALSGTIYLRLLARGIGRLGISSKSVGKVQLLVPVLLVLAASKSSQLELLPCLFGFLLYKPSLIIHFLRQP